MQALHRLILEGQRMQTSDFIDPWNIMGGTRVHRPACRAEGILHRTNAAPCHVRLWNRWRCGLTSYSRERSASVKCTASRPKLKYSVRDRRQLALVAAMVPLMDLPLTIRSSSIGLIAGLNRMAGHAAMCEPFNLKTSLDGVLSAPESGSLRFLRH